MLLFDRQVTAQSLAFFCAAAWKFKYIISLNSVIINLVAGFFVNLNFVLDYENSLGRCIVGFGVMRPLLIVRSWL
jgi:hypothetical protein